MANRFWVLGSGSWSDTAHWSSVSNGAGGSTVPTSSDDVFFDASSFSADAAIVTLDIVASCLSLNSSTASKYFTLTSAINSLSLYGSLTEHATNSRYNFTGTAYLYFKGTGTITTNGNTPYHTWNRMYIDGVGITVTNGDNMSIGATVIYLAQGTWNTNDKTITCTQYLRNDTVTGSRTLNLGSSQFNCGLYCGNSTTFTLNAGTSTVTSPNYITFPSTSYLLYNVIMNGYTTEDINGGYLSNFSCNNFTCNSIAAVRYLVFNGIIIVNGLLTINGYNAANYRLLIMSGTIGTSRTIQVNTGGIVSISNVDFRDMYLRNIDANPYDASAIMGGSGDCGGNTGITFTPAVPQFYKKFASTSKYSNPPNWRNSLSETLSAELITVTADRDFSSDSGNWNKGTEWSISGGKASCSGLSNAGTFILQNNAPLPSTTKVYIISLTISNYVSGTLRVWTGSIYEIFPLSNGTWEVSCDSFTYNRFNVSGNFFIGSIDDISIKEVTNVGRVPLPQDDATFNANSFNSISTLTVDCPRIGRTLDMHLVNQAVTLTQSLSSETYGSYILGPTITPSGTYAITFYSRGAFDFNTYNKTIYRPLFYNIGTYTNRSDITVTTLFGVQGAASIFDLNDFNLTILDVQLQNTGTFYAGNGTIELRNSSSINLLNINGIFYAEGSTIKCNVSGINNMLISFAQTYNKLWLTGTHSGNFDFAANNTIAELVIDAGRKVRFTNGTTQNIAKITAKGTNTNKITIGSTTAAIATLNYTGTIQPDMKFCDISYITATTPFNVRASINSGNNTNITFNPAKFWVGGTGNINDGTHWASTSGGIGVETFGDELVTGGNFESGLIGVKTDQSGSVSTWTLNTIAPISGTQDGRLIITTSNVNRPTLSWNPSSIIINRRYRISFDYKVNSGTASIVQIWNGAAVIQVNALLTGTGTYVYDMYALGTTNFGYFLFSSSLCDIQMDNVSIREMTNLPTSTIDVFFDENSLGANAKVITMNSSLECLSLDFENLTNTMTLVNAAWNLNVYGSLILPASNLTLTFTLIASLYFKSTVIGNTITSGGVTRSWNIIRFDGVGGSWINQDNWNPVGGAYLANGTWNTNDKTITCSSFTSISTGVKTLTLGSSIFNAAWYEVYSTITITPNTSTIIVNSANAYVFYGGGKTYYNVELRGNSNINVNHNNTFNNLSVIKTGSATDAVSFMNNQIINGTLTITGFNSTTYRTLISSNTAGAQRTLTVENILASNVNIQDINLQGNCVKDLSAISGGAQDLGNNSNIRFSPSLKQKGRQLGFNLGSKKQGNSGVQINDQIWTAKNYNESTIGTLVIPEVQEATNVEKLINGSFTTDTIWTKGIGWTISGGLLNINAAAYTFTSQSLSYPINRYVKITYTISNYVSGSVYVYDGTSANLIFSSGNGTYTQYRKNSGNGFYIQAYSSGFIGSIDNVSCELIGWASLDTIPNASDRIAWCNYNNLQSNGDVYGKLYTPQTATEINNQLIAINSDWRIPSIANYSTLFAILGGASTAGGKLKELGLSHWVLPNAKGDNSSGFIGLPAGYRNEFGVYTSYQSNGFFLSTDIDWRMYLSSGDSIGVINNDTNNKWGMSLRLIKK